MGFHTWSTHCNFVPQNYIRYYHATFNKLYYNANRKRFPELLLLLLPVKSRISGLIDYWINSFLLNKSSGSSEQSNSDFVNLI